MIEIVRGANLLDLPVVHDHHPVRQRHRLDLVVRHIDGRRLDLLMHALDFGAHLDAQFGVEIGQRFVEQKHLGIAHDGAAHGHALSLPAGELLRPAGEQFGDVEDARGVVDPLLDLGLGEFPQLEPERHVFGDGHVWIKRVVLEHHRDVAVLRRQIVDHLAADRNLAVADFLQAGDHPQGRALAATRGADQDDKLMIGNVETDIADGDHIAEPLHHIA